MLDNFYYLKGVIFIINDNKPVDPEKDKAEADKVYESLFADDEEV